MQQREQPVEQAIPVDGDAVVLVLVRHELTQAVDRVGGSRESSRGTNTSS